MTRARFHDLAGRSAYQVLGVSEEAAAEEINKGYRRRMRELHPDGPGGGGQGEEARQVTTAHRWLMRHRDSYDVFVSGRRSIDPLWGRAPAPSSSAPSTEEPRRRPAPGTGSLRTPGAPASSAFRSEDQGRLAERATEWAKTQRREQWKPGEAAVPRSAWRRTPATETPSGEMGERGRKVRSAWESQPSPERQIWDASRAEVSRRREERLRAEQDRRQSAREEGSGTRAYPNSAERVPGRGRQSGEAGSAPTQDEAGRSRADDTPPTGRPVFVPSPDSRKNVRSCRKKLRSSKIRWPRLGLPKPPPLGLPQVPRVGLPAMPRIGLPRIGVRVLPRRRARTGVRPESFALAVLIIVLGFLAASRLPL